jgi:integrase
MSMRGLPMTVDSIHALISRLAVAFDKEVSPANIRKSVINYWLNERKILLEDVQIMAGHRYPSTTQRYVNTNTPEQREALSRLHKSIFG